MVQRILQKEPMQDMYRTRIEQEINEISSKVSSGLEKPDLLKYLNLDLSSIFVYTITGKLEKDFNKPKGAENSYMVNGVSIVGFATQDVKNSFENCNYRDFVKVVLASNSLHALDITVL